jgi:hypothetical protein
MAAAPIKSPSRVIVSDVVRCDGLFLVRAYTSKYESCVEHDVNSVWLGPARPSWNRMNVEIGLPLPGEQLR